MACIDVQTAIPRPLGSAQIMLDRPFPAGCILRRISLRIKFHPVGAAGGSTLGNILASSIPLRGVDMGNAILAMHSCRETGSVRDHEYCVKVFTEFYNM